MYVCVCMRECICASMICIHMHIALHPAEAFISHINFIDFIIKKRVILFVAILQLSDKLLRDTLKCFLSMVVIVTSDNLVTCNHSTSWTATGHERGSDPFHHAAVLE